MNARDLQLDAFDAPAHATDTLPRLRATRALLTALHEGGHIEARRRYPFAPTLTVRTVPGGAGVGASCTPEALCDLVAQRVVAPKIAGPKIAAGAPAPAAFDAVDFVLTAEGVARVAAIVGGKSRRGRAA